MPPIASRLIKALRKYEKRKVVDLAEVRASRKNAKRLAEEVAGLEDFAELHPAHALLVYAQNRLSVFVEVISAIPEMSRFADAASEAQDEYLPEGPPTSPLTNSYFSGWAYYDLCFGPRKETLGSCVIEVGRALRVSSELLQIWTSLERSRLGLYRQEGTENSLVILRELVTGTTVRTLVTSGYVGRQGQLWLVRLVPSPDPSFAGSVAMITPYVVIRPDESEWLAFFERMLPKLKSTDELIAYQTLMKHGLDRAYWNEYIFEAYVNHQNDAIFLAGVPDIDTSRPHSRVNGIVV
jgi:hypothetical protein